MADEPDLLRAVLADPDADAPRLAYAAWCSAQPDAATRGRGRFIEAQLALAGLPDDAAPAQRFNLTCDVEDLLTAQGAAWTAEIRRLASTPVFYRGFVALVALSARDFLARADQLFALAPVRHLDLGGVVDVAADLFASPHLQTIRSLDLSRTGLRDEHMEMLARSPFLGELRWLSLAGNGVTMKGAEALAASQALPRLAYVHFQGNPVDPGERQGHDQGVVVDAWLPPEGEALEAQYGPLRWLHTGARTLLDVVPDRLKMR